MLAFAGEKSSIISSNTFGVTGIFLAKSPGAEEHAYGISAIRKLFGVKMSSGGRSIVATKDISKNIMIINQRVVWSGAMTPVTVMIISKDLPELLATVSDEKIAAMTVTRFSREQENKHSNPSLGSSPLISAWGPGGVVMMAIGKESGAQLEALAKMIKTGRLAVSSGNPNGSNAFIDDGIYIVDLATVSTRQELMKTRSADKDGRLSRRLKRLALLAKAGVKTRDQAHLEDRVTDINTYSNRFDVPAPAESSCLAKAG